MALSGLGRLMLLLAGLGSLIALSACAGRGGSVAYEPPGFDAPAVETETINEASLRIAPLDKVKVIVFQSDPLSGEFTVDPQGEIDFPLVGKVPAEGKTTTELAELLTQRLTGRYLRAPNVRVELAQATPRTITVEGSVRQPGVFPVTGSVSLIKAVALARGTSEDANPARVVVFRQVNGERMAAAFDLRAIRRGEADDPPIYGNDIIVVDGNRSRSIFRDVLSAVPILGIFRPF
jgi:polysaccharide export outer membrane protein